MHLSSNRWLHPRILVVLVGLLAVNFVVASAAGDDAKDVAERLSELAPEVLSEKEIREWQGMLQRDILRRRQKANAANRAEWNGIETREQWESYRDSRLSKLRASLGLFPKPAQKLNSYITGVVKGDGFRIANVVYESRRGVFVPGNLYVPDQPNAASFAGILIVHSHHRDKTHGELQDMGMTWARGGCYVLVIDQVGYGERRAHPFHSQKDYNGDFKSWRQDYYYRYDSGVQLNLAGDSLMGWFVWDLMQGVNLLLQQDRIDPNRILILGSVAGGGDPCAITAALDERVAGAVPFNFGGLQPESYPLPENAEETFNFAMSSYWDSTRGLPRTCSDGYFHWTIVGGVAPRPLIYAHEFMWDRERDPVWKRFQKIYTDFYSKPNNLAFALGKGSVKDSSAVATHCTHIGRHHRQYIHPAFKRWFKISVDSTSEYSKRVDGQKLTCFSSAFRERFQPRDFVSIVSAHGAARLAASRRRLAKLSVAEQRAQLQREFARLLGSIEAVESREIGRRVDRTSLPSINIERVVLETDKGVAIPLLLLAPNTAKTPTPVVLAISQTGKRSFLQERAEQLAELLTSGVTVCLPDLRGTGETREGSSRGRTSGDTNRSVNMQMFGETILGQRLRDTRSIVRWLRKRTDVDGDQLSIWGDSFSTPNASSANFRIPHGVPRRARQTEPLGGTVALLTALYEDVRAVYVHRGLASYRDVLRSPHVYTPHDAIPPQMLNVADLEDVAVAVGAARVRLAGMVNGLNVRLSTDEVTQRFRRVDLSVLDVRAQRNAKQDAKWLIETMGMKP